jgi:hypothetical protein
VHTLCFIIMIAIMMVIPWPGHAQSTGDAATVEQLQELRREVEALQERLASLESDVATEQEMAAKTLIGGYIQTTFTDFEKQPSDFNIRRVILFIGAEISRHFRFVSEIEFEFGGTPFKGEEFGSKEPGEVLLEQAYLDWLIHPAINFRGGVVLVPVGAFNTHHDPPERELSERPLVNLFIIPTTWFEVGVGLHGAFAVGNELEMNYEAYVINGLDDNIVDGFGLRQARGSLGAPGDNNDNKAIVGRIGLLPGNIGWLPLNGLDIGLSGYYGLYDDDDDRAVRLLAIDVTYKAGPFTFLFEAARTDIDAGFSNRESNGVRVPVPTQMEGFYAQINYRFWPAFLNSTFLARDDPSFNLAVRYDEIDTDDDRTTAGGDRRRLMVGFNFRPLPETVFKFEWLFDVDDRDNPENLPESGFVFEFSSYF